MNCERAELAIHALVDGELDAVNARDVEEHIASCPACAAQLNELRALRAAMARAQLKEAAPEGLKNRIDNGLPQPEARVVAMRDFARPSRRSFFGGLASGALLGAALAASLMLTVFHNDEEQTVANEVVSAHLRSLQAGHLTDVETSDQHTIKPWFNGKLDVAPPVIDLTAQGFTLVGARLDYINREPVASIVYRRRKHIINVFVARAGAARTAGKTETIQGFNVRHWIAQGLDFWAVSDINAGELDEFSQTFTAALPRLQEPS